MARAMRAHALAPLALALALAAAPARTTAAEYRDDVRFPWAGVRLGGVWALSSASGGAPGAGGIGAYALFDAREYLADVSLDLFFGSDTHFLAAGLGAYYPFIKGGNVTPYLGGGVKAGWTKFGGEGTFGMIPYAAFGVLFGRTYFPQLRLEAAYFLDTSRERGPATGQDGVRAHGPMLTLGLGF